MGLPDPKASRAVLIGASTFRADGLPDLPSVRNNVADLQQLLVSPHGAGLPPEHCTTVVDESWAAVGRALHDASDAAEDSFIVYYAGHGKLASTDQQLFLTAPDTEPNRLEFTAIPYDAIRRALYGARARTRVIVLDCCFSGAATTVMSASGSQVSGQLSIAGWCVLASTTATATSLAPEGEQYTTFTGELINLLRHGTPDAGELLTLDVVYRSTYQALASRGLARPQRLTHGTAEGLALARNAHWSRHDPAEPEQHAHQPLPVEGDFEPPDLTEVVAHGPNADGRWHSLRAHALSTAQLAAEFAQPWGGSQLAHVLGLFHDAGKAYPQWQRRLREVVGTGHQVGRHEELGTRLLKDVAGRSAMAVLGHHRGLADVGALKKVLRNPLSEDEDATRQRFLTEVPEAAAVLEGGSPVPEEWSADPLLYEMGLRMTFSALVDADRLDAAAHEQGAPPEPEISADMAALLHRFEARRQDKLDKATPTPMDPIRREVYDAAVAGAKQPPGIYRLAAPTGAGKTWAQGGFALQHARTWGHRRVVIAMPLITVTEQNARTYRELLDGPEPVVLEHHSHVDRDGAEESQHAKWARNATENWDAPFVLTTTVQLFETLFGRTPTQLRKLHRLANSVLVLDEVQALPSRLLLPILDGLKVLVQHFGVTVLLTSATQPTFHRLSPWQQLDGDSAPTDLVVDAPELFSRARRVRYEWRLQPQPMFFEVATEVLPEHQALVIVNSTGDARHLTRLLAQHRTDVVHLSSRMYPRHRTRQLAVVRERLERGESVLLVSTQLVEAGVDISFPVVWRALAPADSLQQAAGRAGRHGGTEGRVVVFDPVEGSAPQEYATQVAVTRAYFGPGKADPDDVETLAEYYDEVYRRLGLDRATARERRNKHPGQVIQKHRRDLDYRSVADGPLNNAAARSGRDSRQAFRMIADRTVPAVVLDDADEDVAYVRDLVEQVRTQQGPVREFVRALQGWVVQVPRWLLPRLDGDYVQQISTDLACWTGPYDAVVGIDDDTVVVPSGEDADDFTRG